MSGNKSIETKDVLKSYFQTDDTPTETQFATMIDSLAEQVAVDTLSAEVSEIANSGYGFDEYGFFKKPSDFLPALPCNFYKDKTGEIKHDMAFSQYILGTKIYVNLVTGNDTSGTGAVGTPYKTLKKACDIASTGTDSAYCITVLSDSPFMRDESMGTVTFTDKTIAIIHDDTTKRITMSAGQKALVWTADGDGTWKATRNSIYSVFDFRRKDQNGVYIPLENKASIAECQASPNTWYTDGISVWVHTSDGNVPTDSTISANIAAGYPFPKLMGSAKLYLQNCDFALLNNASGGLTINGDSTGATVGGDFIANNCTFASSGKTATDANVSGNALDTINIKNTYLFNCSGAYAKADIFNYHYQNVPIGNRRDCLVVEYNCTAYNAGLNRTDGNNNATTAHEGVNILRIGSLGYNTKGPTLADVGGCYSICINCEMRDSLFELGTFYFEPNTNGKAVIINSKTDDDALGLYSNVKTFVYNFTGNISDTGSVIVVS